jgi:hypothetical protein
MNTLRIAERLTGFRNVVAHSPIAISGYADGTIKIRGIMNVTPTSNKTTAELVSLDELKGRVNESAAVAREMLELQSAFPRPPTEAPPAGALQSAAANKNGARRAESARAIFLAVDPAAMSGRADLPRSSNSRAGKLTAAGVGKPGNLREQVLSEFRRGPSAVS